MNPSFREWLARRGLKSSSVSTQISDVRRLEKHYGDLDELYDQDGCAATLDNLQYSKDDEKQGRPNPIKLEIEGNLYNNLSHFRSTLNVYRDFREATSETLPGEDRWDRYLRRAAQILDDGTLDRDERYAPRSRWEWVAVRPPGRSYGSDQRVLATGPAALAETLAAGIGACRVWPTTNPPNLAETWRDPPPRRVEPVIARGRAR